MIGPWSPGAVVGAYRLERELGRGGMGVVFGATDATTGAPVVIKTLTALDADEVSRLEREGLALARLKHPNLVLVHGAGWHERRPYLVLQYASRGSLADRLKQGPLPWREAAELGAQLAGALAAAHGVGITHRDLKPANVLLHEDGRPLLADFGVAKVSDLSRLTETGAVVGTPLYMSPEQARGVDSGGAADVYSLGALLYAAIAGQPPIPVQPGVIVAQLVALQEETPERLGTLREVPPWLEDTIHAALRRDPEERPSADEVRERLLAGPSAEANPSRVPAALGVAAALALLSAVAVLMLSRGSAVERIPSPVQTSPPASRPSPADETRSGPYPLEAALHRDLQAHLQGLKERHLAEPSLSPEDRTFLARLPELDSRQLGVLARNYDLKDPGLEAQQRQRRGTWAALELSTRGYLDWLGPAYRGEGDVRDSLPMVTRLARSGHTGAQELFSRIRTLKEIPEEELAYFDAYHVLATSTGLHLPHSAGPIVSRLGKRLARSTRPPGSVGVAWLRVYQHEALDTRSRIHRQARAALGGPEPSKALPLYREAWRRREGDVESLAFELAVAADWKWTRHLHYMGHHFTAGTPPPPARLSREALRAEIREVLQEVEWGRAYYFFALTYVPEADPTRPHPAPSPPIDYGPMIAATERALELDPGLSPARLLVASIHRWQGEPEAALAMVRSLEGASPHWVGARLLFEALVLLEASREAGGPLPQETRELYLRARDANKGLSLGWNEGYLQVLYESLDRPR